MISEKKPKNLGSNLFRAGVGPSENKSDFWTNFVSFSPDLGFNPLIEGETLSLPEPQKKERQKAMILSQNEDNGFFGTISESPIIKALLRSLFDKVAKKIHFLCYVNTEEEAVAFLDSRMGRHLADQCLSAESEIEILQIISTSAPKYIAAWKKLS